VQSALTGARAPGQTRPGAVSSLEGGQPRCRSQQAAAAAS